MRLLNLTHFPVVALFVLSGLRPTASAQNIYSFTRIADTNFFLISGATAPSLSDSGMVAFETQAPGGQSGIFAGGGTEKALSDYLVIAKSAPGFSVNAPGSYVGSQVAFFAITSPLEGTGGYFSSDGFSQQTIIIDPLIGIPTQSPPLMNHAGQVPYVVGGVVTPRKLGLYIGQNGSSTAVYPIPDVFIPGPVQMHNLFHNGNTQISDAGALFFHATFFNNPLKPGDPQTDLDGLLQGSVNGETPTQLVFDGTDTSFTTYSVGEFAANNSGQAVCIVEVIDSLGSFHQLVKVSGGATAVITDTRSGPFLEISDVFSVNDLAINDAGTVVFPARFKDANGNTQTGLFTGSDPANDKVVATGDALLNSTVTSLFFSRVGFNNQGQIAFKAWLANGNSGIFRADPSAGGTQVVWAHDGGGSFSDASNWQPVNGDPPRVPEKTTTISDTAVFDRGSAYSVNFGGSEHAERLVVKNDDVTFISGSLKVDALSFDEPSLLVDNAHLSLLSTSFLTNNHALVGEFLSSTVDVGLGGTWVTLGSLRVGGGGTGILNIDLGSVNSAESRIGTGFGGGRVTVGDGSEWITGNLAVGAGGKGQLTISQGGSVTSDVAYVGQQPSLGNSVTVQGNLADPGSSDPSVWHVGYLGVGAAGSGRLEVNDGALVDALVVRVARQPVATGAVHVSGVNANGSPSELSTGYLLVGENGVGELVVDGGGVVDVSGDQADFATQNGAATVAVTGTDSSTHFPSTFKLGSINGVLSVGNHSSASLSIENGGLVDVGGLTVVFSQLDSSPSEIKVVGADSLLSSAGMKVGGSGNKGAFLTLVEGEVEARGGLYVGANGTVRGFGTLNVTPGNRFTNDGGTISPGLSPGRLVLNGDYQQINNGRMVIEIGGYQPGMSHDQFVVNGNATLGGTLELRFIDGFAPKQGDSFNFLQVSGALGGSFAAIELYNLAPDFQFNLSTNGTNVSLVAMTEGTFITPLQGQISSSNVVTIGGISYLPYTLNSTNPCNMVIPVGAVTRQGAELFQTLKESADPNCSGASADVSRVLPLGELPSGSYQFHFVMDGVNVSTRAFDVPPGTGQLLSFSRTLGGDLNLQINGLSSVQYIIQASDDLLEWSDLSTHVGTFFGPYNIFESLSASKSRFYRIAIH